MATALPPGYRHRAYDTLPSTSDEALAAARGGEAGGLWISAGEQTEGRGRRGRAWIGGRGNVAASLMLVDPAPPEVAATISFAAAVALHQAVIDLAGPAIVERLALKWPNDLLLDRFKVAGILLEGEKLATGNLVVVIGVGVNCVAHPDVESGHPTSDLLARGVPVDVEALFQGLATRMAEEITTWDGGAGFAAVRAAWLARSTGVGEPVRISLTDRTVDGRFETLDEAGRLIVSRSDGVREAVSAGDVFFAWPGEGGDAQAG